MKVSREKLLSEAAKTGFRPEILEKVIHLLSLLESLNSHPFLKGRLALKGGTALNLFVFDLPRLSIDINLNYIGSVRREDMLAERPRLETAIKAVCRREDLSVRRTPEDHAGGKWRLRHQSALGQGGNLDLDVNFMLRAPLWPVNVGDSLSVGSYRAAGIPILDTHELAAGKLVALFARHQSRDLFDAHQLLTRCDLDREPLRLGFVVYGAMSRRDWRTVNLDEVRLDRADIQDSLVPMLRAGSPEDVSLFATRLGDECRGELQSILPFSAKEQEFLDGVLDAGEIEPTLLTADDELAGRIKQHPMLQWKALNVRQHKGGAGDSNR